MMSDNIRRSKFLVGLGFSLVLFCLVFLMMKPFVTEIWGCAIAAEVSQYQKQLQKIEDDHKDDIYFWAWINDEGYKPQQQAPAVSSCSAEKDGKMQDWADIKLWSYIYPKTYQETHQTLQLLNDLKESVQNRMKNFEERRESWWQPLSEDLKKICSLYQQVKRLSELKIHLLSSCPNSVNANHPCLKELKNVEKLVEKEEKPFNENLSKMESKWPYLASLLRGKEFHCEIK